MLTNTNRNRELGQLIMCSRNLYLRCKHYLRGIHHFQDLDTTEDDTDDQEKVDDEYIKHMDQLLIKNEISQKLKIIAHYIKDCNGIVSNYNNNKTSL